MQFLRRDFSPILPLNAADTSADTSVHNVSAVSNVANTSNFAIRFARTRLEEEKEARLMFEGRIVAMLFALEERLADVEVKARHWEGRNPLFDDDDIDDDTAWDDNDGDAVNVGDVNDVKVGDAEFKDMQAELNCSVATHNSAKSLREEYEEKIKEINLRVERILGEKKLRRRKR